MIVCLRVRSLTHVIFIRETPIIPCCCNIRETPIIINFHNRNTTSIRPPPSIPQVLAILDFTAKTKLKSFGPLLNVKYATRLYTCSVLNGKLWTPQHVSSVRRNLRHQLMLYHSTRQDQLIVWIRRLVLYLIVRPRKILRKIFLYRRNGQILSRAIHQPQTFLSAGIFMCVICNKKINMKTSFVERGRWK